MAVIRRILFLITCMFASRCSYSRNMQDSFVATTPPNPEPTTIDYNDTDSANYILKMLPTDLLDRLENNMMWEVINTYCPLLSNCSMATNNRYFVTGCCLNCECGDDCFVKGNCCHDKESDGEPIENIRRTTIDGRACVTVDIASRYWQDLKSYLLKVTCTNFENTNTVNHCQLPLSYELADMTPVTSLESGMSYTNKFCAACNNDDANLTYWEQKLDCGGINNIPAGLLTPGFSDQDIYYTLYMHRQCLISWRPPDDHPGVEECFPVETIFSSCPPYAPAILQKLCMGHEAPFIPYAGETFLYKNMFCLACNIWDFYEQLVPAIDVNDCPARRNQQPLSPDFVILLNMNALSSLPADMVGRNQDEECDEGFIYNKDLVYCFKLCCCFIISVSFADLTRLSWLLNTGSMVIIYSTHRAISLD